MRMENRTWTAVNSHLCTLFCLKVMLCHWPNHKPGRYLFLYFLGDISNELCRKSARDIFCGIIQATVAITWLAYRNKAEGSRCEPIQSHRE